MASDKHDGQLKRICAPCIKLLRFLVQFDSEGEEDSVFLDRFVSLAREDLALIQFSKHILNDDHKSGLLGKSRAGNADDAMELLSVILTYHRDSEGNDDPIDINFFLGDSKATRDRFTNWLQKTANEEVCFIY